MAISEQIILEGRNASKAAFQELERDARRVGSGITQTMKSTSASASAFTDGLKSGSSTLADFGQQLLKQGQSMGMTDSQLRKMASATGIWSDKQIVAGITAANMTEKSRSLAAAVAKGEMTARQAGAAFSAYAKELGVSADAAQSPLANFKALSTTMLAVAGVATTVGVALKEVYDLGKGGAQIERTEEKFYRLADAIGTTGDALRTDLKTAIRGMATDVEVMESATSLLELGLAKSHEEAVRLTRVAGALNMPMNQLVLTLTNMTTMRFDALGISVDGFEEKLKSLEAQGLDTNAAFKEAFLQQAEAQIELVGEAADSNAGKIQAFEKAVQSLADTQKQKMVPAVAGVAEWLTKEIDFSVRLAAVKIKLTAAYKSGAISAGEYNSAIHGLTFRTKELSEVELEMLALEAVMRDDRRESIELAEEAAEANDELAGIYQEVGLESEGARARLAMYNNALLDQASRMGEVASASEVAREGMAGYVRMTREAGKASEESQSGIQGILGILDADVASPLAAFIEDMKWLQAGGWQINEAFKGIQAGLESGEITPAQAEQWAGELFKATQDLQVDLNMITADDAAANIQETLGGSLEGAKERITGTEGIMGALQALTSQKWYVDVYFRQHGTLPNLSAPSGGGETGKGPRKGEEFGGQFGLDMVVPPGYPNDSLPVWVSSGERVIVVPEGKRGGMAPSINNTYHVTLNDRLAAKMFLDQERRKTLERAESLMS